MVFGAHLPEVLIGVGALILDPIIQGQREVDSEVDGVDCPIEKPVLGQAPSVCGPIGEKSTHGRLFPRVLIDVAVFF